MADFELSADAATRVKDAAEPIKRQVERSEKPNPLIPALEASWEARTKRNGSTETETGATKSYRSYSPAETLAVVRALRRGSDKLGLGVRIVAPQTTTPVTDEDGNPVYLKDKDGNVKVDGDGNPRQKVKLEYRTGTVIFETHTRQKRSRAETEDAADETEDAGTDAGTDETEDDDSTTDDANEDDSTQENEPAWQ